MCSSRAFTPLYGQRLDSRGRRALGPCQRGLYPFFGGGLRYGGNPVQAMGEDGEMVQQRLRDAHGEPASRPR